MQSHMKHYEKKLNPNSRENKNLEESYYLDQYPASKLGLAFYSHTWTEKDPAFKFQWTDGEIPLPATFMLGE